MFAEFLNIFCFKYYYLIKNSFFAYISLNIFFFPEHNLIENMLAKMCTIISDGDVYNG